MNESGTFDPFQVMQRAFPPASGLTAAARQNATSFWNAQEALLGSMQEFADGWFERRHVGTQEALSAARRVCDAETPFDALRECQRWAIGSFERAMQDGFAAQKQLLEFGHLSAPPLAQAAETMGTETSEAPHKVQPRARVA